MNKSTPLLRLRTRGCERGKTIRLSAGLMVLIASTLLLFLPTNQNVNQDHGKQGLLRNPVLSAVRRQIRTLFNNPKSRSEPTSSSSPTSGTKTKAQAKQKLQPVVEVFPEVKVPEIKLDGSKTLSEDENAQKEILLRQLPNHQVFKNFVDIMQIPRQTFKEYKIREWAKKVALNTGCQVKMDSVGNLLIKRPASPGYENRPTIALQAHMDMVCEKAAGTLTNFDVDPIKGRIEDGWLKGVGTTLGADNGVGVAAALAILQEPYLQAGAIEILLTIAEEKDMIGAAGIDPNLMHSDVLINLDSESGHEICAGSAGGFGKVIKGNPAREERAKNEVMLEISIGNFAGGHTGVNIHEGHANAVVVSARMLDELLSRGVGARLVSFSGGSAHNAIPRHVDCSIYVPEDEKERAEGILKEAFNEIHKEYAGFEAQNWRLDTKSCSQDSYHVALTEQETRSLVDLVMQIPDGVDRNNPDGMEGVESSMSLSIVTVNPVNGQFQLELFARSSSPSRLRFLDRRLDSLARSHLAEASDKLRAFPGWSPKAGSEALQSALSSHVKLFEKKPKIFSVHAGLECGILTQKYPNLDTISIGPTILGAHTTEERLEIKSVIPFYNWLKEIVVNFGSEDASKDEAFSEER
mmetsp:Transcript_7805/g.9465  ORF Transcript_7805/g.9465 Transcript_7805/m.9465 type:complete len:636 (-) Transcript_7805:456-2363(-)